MKEMMVRLPVVEVSESDDLWLAKLWPESGIEQNFMVVKTNGDTLRLKAKNWRWDGSHNVVFMSDNGSQYVSDVKDILKEE